MSAKYTTVLSIDKNISKFHSKTVDNLSDACYTNGAEVIDMMNIASAIRNTISISLFNRGLAGKIFEEVKQSGAKVVMKNNAAECVLLSPDEYLRLIDEVNDARLLTMANERMAHYDEATVISGNALYEELGITQEALDSCGEVDIE